MSWKATALLFRQWSPKIALSSALLLFSLLLSANVNAQIHDPQALKANPETAQKPIAPALQGLGEHHFPVTTSSQQSQAFFDQGYRLTLGFNHSEALRAFKESARLDPKNAMAYWGMALVLGPNLNLPMQDDVAPIAYEAVQRAVQLKSHVSEREQDYIDALAVRYQSEPEKDRSNLDKIYVQAMQKLVQKYPEDLDAATLYAAAIMNTNPWNYWYRDGTAKPGTEEIVKTLKKVIAENPEHAGAHHYFIHLVEAFHPEKAIDSADKLGKLMPGAGHLVHMPAHIYMRIGRYSDSYKANMDAIKADEGYITQCRAQGLYPLGYYPHNIHFLSWSAMFMGRSQDALSAARKVADNIPDFMQGNTWGLNETFVSQPIFVMARFGLWDQMLEQARPPETSRFMTGIWHYGRGMAYLHQGKTEQSERELQALQTLYQKVENEPEYYVGFGAASSLLDIAQEVLSGELFAKRRDYQRAIAHLSRAVRLEDGLMYNEPPDWYFPVRHILGAVLLENDQPVEAEVVYWQDLQKNPNNGYALKGIQQALEAQGRTVEANIAKQRFEQAWKDADIELASSRF